MIDPTLIASSTIAHLLGTYTNQNIQKILGESDVPLGTLLKEQTILLARILEELSPDDNTNLLTYVALNVYPFYYEVPAPQRAHMCALIPSGITISYQAPGMAAINRPINQGGWYLLDLPIGTQIYANQTTQICIRWCDLPIGQQF